MQPNPYEAPKFGTPSPRTMPRRICLAGLALMFISVAGLCGAGKFQNGGVTYLYAALPISLAALFCLGSIAFIGGGIFWLFSWITRSSTK